MRIQYHERRSFASRSSLGEPPTYPRDERRKSVTAMHRNWTLATIVIILLCLLATLAPFAIARIGL